MKLKLLLPILAAVILMAGAMSLPRIAGAGGGCCGGYASCSVALPPQTAVAADRKILYYSCPMHPSVKSDKPGSCSICGMSLEPVYGTIDVTNNPPAIGTNNAASSDSKPIPYPVDFCFVDGMKLGSMGDPYVFVYQGQEVKMCCAGCKPTFLKNPDKYMKRIQDAEAAAKK
jgi:YHS domain-containing protein